MGNRLCDYCSEEKGSPVEGFDERYCHNCNTDPFRNALLRISEVVGVPHHVSREICVLEEKVRKLEEKIMEIECSASGGGRPELTDDTPESEDKNE